MNSHVLLVKKKLCVLDLSNNEIGNDGAKALAEALERNTVGISLIGDTIVFLFVADFINIGFGR